MKKRHYSRHAHGETLDHDIVIEWFQDKSAYQRMVDSRIAVFPQFGQLMLPDVHHVALVLFPGRDSSCPSGYEEYGGKKDFDFFAWGLGALQR